MSVKVEQRLMEFGLSKAQAEVYMLLTQNGELRIQQIVVLSGIPRSSVYEHLRALEKNGLIERIVGENFVRVKAYPLDALRHNLEQQISELGKLENAISKLPAPQSGTTTIRYYKGVAGARQLFWNSLKAANAVYVYSAWGRGSYVGTKFYKSFVQESRARSIHEKVLINPSEHALSSIRQYSGSAESRTKPEDIRTLSKHKVNIKGETLIYNNIYAQVYLKEEEINGFEVESDLFTETQRSIFETLWEVAKPLDIGPAA